MVDRTSVQFIRLVYDPALVVNRLKKLDLPAPVFAQLSETFLTGS